MSDIIEYRKLKRKAPGIESTCLVKKKNTERINPNDYLSGGKLVSAFSTASTTMSADNLMFLIQKDYV